MILRLLLIAIAMVVLLRLLGWKPRFGRGSESTSHFEDRQGVDSGNTQDDLRQKVDADLVICARCGLSVPRNTAYSHAGRWACSVQHLEPTS
jgi:recombinational DNA repair protein (RecF pathway)